MQLSYNFFYKFLSRLWPKIVCKRLQTKGFEVENLN